jgi:acyl-CoA synthetase (NDP forming)
MEDHNPRNAEKGSPLNPGGLARIGRLLRPRSIAIVGASRDPKRMGSGAIPALETGRYSGKIFPVNPNYDEIGGHRCYKSLIDISEPVDHCVIAVGRNQVADVLRECRIKNVGGASIWSSGYGEMDPSGSEAEAQLRALAGEMPFLGPNCMGFANLCDGIIASSAAIVFQRNADCGDVALLSQSGGVAFASMAFFADEIRMRFSYVINTGNTAGISFDDLVQFMYADPSTRIIVAVAESEAVAAQIVTCVRRDGLKKPIILLKLGRGATGIRMAHSHTGSLAGDYRLVRDCAEQTGIICVDDIDEALDAANLLRHGLDGRHAEGIASISISGGNLTLFADHADAQGLSFAKLNQKTEADLRAALPDFISIHNPVDVTGLGRRALGLYAQVLDILMRDPAARLLVPIITASPDYTPTCTMLSEFKRQSGCAMIVLWTGGSFEERSIGILREAGIPVIRNPGGLARVLGRLRRARAGSAASDARAERLPISASSTAMTEGDALAFLAAEGVPVAPWRQCGRDDVISAVAEVGYPLVIKTDVVETHISDRGGVILGIVDEEDLARRSAQIAALPGERLLVSRFLPGLELIVSAFRHPHFGRVLMLGSGGQLVELVADVTFLLAPGSPIAIERALLATAVGRALKSGHRGATGFQSAVEFLKKFNAFASALDDSVQQVELNPVTVGPHGAAAVDAAIVVDE